MKKIVKLIIIEQCVGRQKLPTFFSLSLPCLSQRNTNRLSGSFWGHGSSLPTQIQTNASHLSDFLLGNSHMWMTLQWLQLLTVPRGQTSEFFLFNSKNHESLESETLCTERMYVYACSVAGCCPTLCSPMDSSQPGSSVHGISQARTLDWLAISFSRGSSQPKDQTGISCISFIDRQILYRWATDP